MSWFERTQLAKTLRVLKNGGNDPPTQRQIRKTLQIIRGKGENNSERAKDD